MQPRLPHGGAQAPCSRPRPAPAVASLYLKRTDEFCCHMKESCLQTLKPEFLLKFKITACSFQNRTGFFKYPARRTCAVASAPRLPLRVAWSHVLRVTLRNKAGSAEKARASPSRWRDLGGRRTSGITAAWTERCSGAGVRVLRYSWEQGRRCPRCGPAEGRRPAGGPVGTVWPLPAFVVALPVVPERHCLRCHSEPDLGQLSVSVL